MAISNEKVEVTGIYCNERYVNVALFSKMRNWNTSTGTPGSCSDSRDGHEVTGRESAESVETLDKGPSHVLGVTERGSVRFHHSTDEMVHNLKLRNCLLLEFSI